MDLNEYQAAVMTHGLREQGKDLFYPALGLAGEAGEVVDEIKKLYRDDGGKLTTSRAKKLLLEMGDLSAYQALLADMLGMTLEEIAQANLKKIKKRNKRRKESS